MKRCRPQASIPQTGIHTKPKVLKGNYYGIQIKELAIGIHSVKRLACAPYNQGLGPCHPQPLHVNGLVSRYVQGYRTSFYYKLYHLLFLISIIPFVFNFRWIHRSLGWVITCDCKKYHSTWFFCQWHKGALTTNGQINKASDRVKLISWYQHLNEDDPSAHLAVNQIENRSVVKIDTGRHMKG